MRIDLDQNATTPADPRVVEAMVEALRAGGNASSVHERGRRARERVEQARRTVARLVGGEGAGDVVFTSGGTEADLLGVVGGARAARARGGPARVVSSPLEHPAVLGALAILVSEGFTVDLVPVDRAGRVTPGELARTLGRDGAALVTLATANHELGNLFDVPALARVAHAAGAWFHTDAVQAAGKVPLAVRAWEVDLVSISGHKIRGPQGVGALWVARSAAVLPLSGAGHQERGLRPGTENVPAIAGLGVAAGLAEDTPAHGAAVAARRDRLEEAALALGARRHGDPEARVANTTNLAFPGVPGELLVQALDLEGVSVSTGAACTSGRVEASPVVRALGWPVAEAREAVRFSLGPDVTDSDVDRVIALLPVLVARIRRWA